METLMQQLGKQAGSFTQQLDKEADTKTASTALVRAIQLGKLSTKGINRAARAMPPGQFRTIKNLGRGQFNVADKVVGNVGGHAGEMVRKLPTHRYVNPQTAYKGLIPKVNELNSKYPTATGAPAIAPYHAVNPKGAFQEFSTAKTLPANTSPTKYWLNHPISKEIGDLHSGNFGPGGQIIDFTAKGLGWSPSTAKRVSTMPVLRGNIPGGFDPLANLPPVPNVNNFGTNTLWNRLPPHLRTGLPVTSPRIKLWDRFKARVGLRPPGFTPPLVLPRPGIAPQLRKRFHQARAPYEVANNAVNNEVRKYYHTLTPAQRLAGGAVNDAGAHDVSQLATRTLPPSFVTPPTLPPVKPPALQSIPRVVGPSRVREMWNKLKKPLGVGVGVGGTVTGILPAKNALLPPLDTSVLARDKMSPIEIASQAYARGDISMDEYQNLIYYWRGFDR